MANKKKKVLFIILEGNSDEVFFFDALERYKNEQIVIKAYDGDIFTDPKQGQVETRERIRRFFIDRLGDLKLNDILGIVHISDTDGSYISNDKVIVNKEQVNELVYAIDGIYVNEEAEKEKKEFRNQLKKQNTVPATQLNQVQYKGVKIPYRLFFLSQNIEHVVFNELNVSSKEKMKNMVIYLRRVRGTTELDDLLKSLLPVINEGSNNKHRDSWDFILNGDHSLQRCSNVILMYEFIDQIISPS